MWNQFNVGIGGLYDPSEGDFRISGEAIRVKEYNSSTVSNSAIMQSKCLYLRLPDGKQFVLVLI